MLLQVLLEVEGLSTGWVGAGERLLLKVLVLHVMLQDRGGRVTAVVPVDGEAAGALLTLRYWRVEKILSQPSTSQGKMSLGAAFLEWDGIRNSGCSYGFP